MLVLLPTPEHLRLQSPPSDETPPPVKDDEERATALEDTGIIIMRKASD
jgi:hypothetical protein